MIKENTLPTKNINLSIECIILIFIFGVTLVSAKYLHSLNVLDFSYFKKNISYGVVFTFFISCLYLALILLITFLLNKQFFHILRTKSYRSFLSIVIAIIITSTTHFLSDMIIEKKLKLSKWEHQQSLLRKSIKNEDVIGANKFYSSLLSTLYPMNDKNNICLTKSDIAQDVFMFGADIFEIEKNYTKALECINKTILSTDDSQIKYKFNLRKYKLLLKTKDYSKAFSAYIYSQIFKKQPYEIPSFFIDLTPKDFKLTNIINEGRDLLHDRIKSKDINAASEILELLLNHLYPNQNLTAVNICEVNNELPPELLIITADVLLLEDKRDESRKCLEKAYYNLRYNLNENLSFNQIKMEDILKKLDRHDSKIISNEK